VSLSIEPTFSLIKSDFVCGYRNIVGMPWAGDSGIHPVEGGAVTTTNGAGPHNIQMFVLNQQGMVLTCLPGYWDSNDLSIELKFAETVNDVWNDSKLSLAEKKAKYSEMHLAHIAEHPKAMVKRSQMQGFDKKYEADNRAETSDTILAHTGGPAKLKGLVFKTTDQIFHERLAKQPFVTYDNFDVTSFSDYGKHKYDKKEEGELPKPPKRGKGKRGGG
jgi:hypothetical protein